MTPIMPLIILIVGAFVIYPCSEVLRRVKKEYLVGIIATIFFTIALWSILVIALDVWSGGESTYYLTSATAFSIALRADALAIFLGIVAISMGLIVSIYSINYMKKDTRLDKYYSLLILLVAGIVGIGFSGDIFNLYVFYELMCISSYVLVAFRRENWEPVEAGFKYLVMSATGSCIALFAISIIFAQTGTLDFALLTNEISNVSNQAPLFAAVCFLIVGFGVKAAIVPLHTWLPDAHAAAPSGISAMLSGIVIQSGFFAMIRILLIFSGTSLTQNFGFTLAIFGLITMTVGNIMALVQTDLKRMLAYSSVTQMGYILVGIGLAFEFGEIARAGLEGGLFHIITHAFMKGLAFLCAGAIIYRVGTRDIRKMKGIGRTMPLTALAFAIAGLSLAGVPPFSGFMSKWFIYKVGVDIYPQIGSWGLIFTLMAVFNSILSLGYYLPAINTFFFAKETSELAKKAKEVPLSMLIAMCVMVAITILLGIAPMFGLKIVDPAVVEIMLKLVGGV